MKKVVLIVTIIALAFSVFPCVSVFALEQTQNEMNILVDEPFYDLDIFELQKHSSSVDNIFTMAYDRLFAFENGRIVSDLALSWEMLEVDDYELLPDPPEISISYAWPECPLEWVNGYDDIPGMLDNPGNLSNLNFIVENVNIKLRITLRRNVFFINEDAFTASDVCQLIETAHGCGQNTLIYKQWESVYFVNAVNDYTVDLYMYFPENIGYMDFMYSLTTPIASIVKRENGGNFGTGAYSIVGCEENVVNLERNSSWWKGTLDTSVDFVNFHYLESAAECLTELKSYRDQFALSIADGNVSQVSDEIDSNVLKLEKRIPTNPIALLINNRDEVLSDADFRRVIFWAIDANDIVNTRDFNLVNASHDYWTYDGHNYPAGFRTDDAYLGTATAQVDDKKGEYGFEQIALSLIVSEDFYNRDVAIKLNNDLKKHFVATIEVQDDNTFNTSIDAGFYQLALHEIELTDIDSAYKYLHGCGANMRGLLDAMRWTKDIHTFMVMHVGVQAERVNNSNMFIVGWKYKSMVSNGNVTGFKTMEKYNPVSMISYLDLRGIDYITNR